MSDGIINIDNFHVMDMMYYFKCAIYFCSVVVINGILAYHWPVQFLGLIGILLVVYFSRKFIFTTVVDSGGEDVAINLTREQIETDGRNIPFRAIKNITVTRQFQGNLIATFFFTRYLGLNWSVKSLVKINLTDGTQRDIFLGNYYASQRFINVMRRFKSVTVI